MNQRRYFLNIASGYSGGRDCATVYASHVGHLFVCRLRSRLEAYAIVPLFERAQKKILPEGRGVTPASLRAVHSGRIMGQEAVPSRGGGVPFYRCLLLQQQSASHLIGRFRAHQIVHHGHAESIDHAWLFV